MAMIKKNSGDFDFDQPMSKSTTLSVYEGLRGVMPKAKSPPPTPQRHERLRDILGQFDALLLDGYGVLNIGGEAVPEADDLLAMAASAGVATIVLTNGASKPSQMTWSKYQQLGLDLDPAEIISSRDALIAHLNAPQTTIKTMGVVDSFTEGVMVDGVAIKPLHPDRPDEWQNLDAIGVFGTVHWNKAWQECLVKAMASGVEIFVANPDVAAPQEQGYSREPGYWVAAAAHQCHAVDQVKWFGKPHAPVFDLALQRLEELTSRSNLDLDRIAMVGDSLHTDILGGQARGLKTVLITGHGLFRDGGADQAMTASGIFPDFITASV